MGAAENFRPAAAPIKTAAMPIYLASGGFKCFRLGVFRFDLFGVFRFDLFGVLLFFFFGATPAPGMLERIPAWILPGVGGANSKGGKGGKGGRLNAMQMICGSISPSEASLRPLRQPFTTISPTSRHSVTNGGCVSVLSREILQHFPPIGHVFFMLINCRQ